MSAESSIMTMIVASKAIPDSSLRTGVFDDFNVFI
jgi:hypothetical protein